MGEGSRSWVWWKIIQKRSSVQTLLIISILLDLPLLGYQFEGIKGSDLLNCYESYENRIPELKEFFVPSGRSFFFHETSCSFNYENDFPVNARRACAVESAALHHPQNFVYLLISSPVGKRFNETKNNAIKALLKYRNIRIRHIVLEKKALPSPKVNAWILGVKPAKTNSQAKYGGWIAGVMFLKNNYTLLQLNTYLEETPLHDLSEKLRTSLYGVEHLSDVLRIATLFKFLGTYLDTDVIVLKPLNQSDNYVGAESMSSLANGVISISNDKVGRKVAMEFTDEIRRTFNGRFWSHNGPGAITRVLQRKCNTKKISEMLKADCQGFHVLPTNKIYALHYNDAQKFFKSGQLSFIQNKLNNSFVTHYWNKLSSKFKIPNGDLTVPFLYYAKIHCPVVYSETNGTF